MTALRALTERLRSRDVGAVELIEATLADIAAREPALNAFVHVSAERALAAARAADARTGPRPPLHGVPFSVKEQIDVADVPARDASLLLEPAAPRTDAAAVARLREAGAIVVATSNMSELALFPDSVNRVHGATRNPHDPTRSAGGSSGGDAAAVAAGLVCFGLGSDYGGSIRCPAHFCGIAGLRPGPGVVPAAGAEGRLPTVGRSLLTTVGPLARTVGDLGVVLDALVPRSRRPPLLRVTTTLATTFDALDERCAAAVHAAARALERLGLERVDDAGPPPAAAALFDELTAIETHHALAPLLPGREAEASEQLLAVWHGITGLDPSPEAHADGLARLPALQHEVRRWLGPDRVLVAPAAAVVAYELGRTDGVFELFADCTLASVAGLPALVVPACGDGLPVGVQLVGPPGSEHLLVQLGCRLEAALDAVTCT